MLLTVNIKSFEGKLFLQFYDSCKSLTVGYLYFTTDIEPKYHESFHALIEL